MYHKSILIGLWGFFHFSNSIKLQTDKLTVTTYRSGVFLTHLDLLS